MDAFVWTLWGNRCANLPHCYWSLGVRLIPDYAYSLVLTWLLTCSLFWPLPPMLTTFWDFRNSGKWSGICLVGEVSVWGSVRQVYGGRNKSVRNLSARGKSVGYLSGRGVVHRECFPSGSAHWGCVRLPFTIPHFYALYYANSTSQNEIPTKSAVYACDISSDHYNKRQSVYITSYLFLQIFKSMHFLNITLSSFLKFYYEEWNDNSLNLRQFLCYNSQFQLGSIESHISGKAWRAAFNQPTVFLLVPVVGIII